MLARRLRPRRPRPRRDRRAVRGRAAHHLPRHRRVQRRARRGRDDRGVPVLAAGGRLVAAGLAGGAAGAVRLRARRSACCWSAWSSGPLQRRFALAGRGAGRHHRHPRPAARHRLRGVGAADPAPDVAVPDARCCIPASSPCTSTPSPTSPSCWSAPVCSGWRCDSRRSARRSARSSTGVTWPSSPASTPTGWPRSAGRSGRCSLRSPASCWRHSCRWTRST